MNNLNKIFNTKNIPFTIGWIIGIGLSIVVLIQFEPEKPFFEVFNTAWFIAQLIGLLLWLTVLNYWDELSIYVIKTFYVIKSESIIIYNQFKKWLNE